MINLVFGFFCEVLSVNCFCRFGFSDLKKMHVVLCMMECENLGRNMYDGM